MNILFWRKNALIDKMAVILADEFYSQVQPQVASSYFSAAEHNNKERKKFKGLENMINKTASQIIVFRKENSIGIYGKARLHMKFVERLKELGYAEHIVRQINEILLLRSP